MTKPLVRMGYWTGKPTSKDPFMPTPLQEFLAELKPRITRLERTSKGVVLWVDEEAAKRAEQM